MNGTAIVKETISNLMKVDCIVDNPLVLISAYPRSGTKYITGILRQAGLDVNHELLYPDGCVSWFHVVFADKLKFKHIFHQTRHPLSSIGSSQQLSEDYIDYMGQFFYIPERDTVSTLKRRIYSWVGWNEYISEKAEWHFRVEDLEKQINELLNRLGMTQSASIIFDFFEGKKDYPLVTWENIKEEGLEKEVSLLAIKYGYLQ